MGSAEFGGLLSELASRLLITREIGDVSEVEKAFTGVYRGSAVPHVMRGTPVAYRQHKRPESLSPGSPPNPGRQQLGASALAKILPRPKTALKPETGRAQLRMMSANPPEAPRDVKESFSVGRAWAGSQSQEAPQHFRQNLKVP